MRRVIEADLERSIVTRSRTSTPSRSRGVDRPGLPGRAPRRPPVAVKVQYPGINAAVRADMKNLGVLMRLVRSITPRLDVRPWATRSRADRRELDYELEAVETSAPWLASTKATVQSVPHVVSSLCRERVIVSELVVGDGFEVLRSEPEAERDRIGEIVFRFYFGSMYLHRRFSGDPHPGNMIRLADGRVAFLDFGLFKTITREVAELELACQRATAEGDAAELHRLMRDAGFLPRGDRLDAAELLAFVRDGSGGTRPTSRLRSTRTWSTRVHPDHRPSLDPLQRGPPPDIAPEHLFGRRLELLRSPSSASSDARRTGIGSPANGCTTRVRDGDGERRAGFWARPR